MNLSLWPRRHLQPEDGREPTCLPAHCHGATSLGRHAFHSSHPSLPRWLTPLSPGPWEGSNLPPAHTFGPGPAGRGPPACAPLLPFLHTAGSTPPPAYHTYPTLPAPPVLYLSPATFRLGDMPAITNVPRLPSWRLPPVGATTYASTSTSFHNTRAFLHALPASTSAFHPSPPAAACLFSWITCHTAYLLHLPSSVPVLLSHRTYHHV